MSEKIVQLNEEVIKGQIKELVRGSVEETLNELLEQEAESLTQAARYERSVQQRHGRYCVPPQAAGLSFCAQLLSPHFEDLAHTGFLYNHHWLRSCLFSISRNSGAEAVFM